MKYLLDTNSVIFLFKEQFGVKEKIKKAGIKNCFISDIILAELLYGAYHSNDVTRHLKQIANLTKIIKVLSISDAIDIFAQQKSMLRKKGTPIDDFDLLIGATALQHDLILVTNNTKHFARIDGLKLEDWVERY